MTPERSLTRRPAGERRRLILAAARDVFARRGFHGASTAEIAALAECSEPTIYKHFTSKQDLFGAVLRDAGEAVKEQVRAVLEAADDPLTALLGASRNLVADPDWVQLVRLRTLAVTMADDPTIREALAENATAHRRTVTNAVRASQERGRVRPDVDADAIGWIAVALSLLANYRNAIEGATGLADMPRLMGALADLIRPTSEEIR